MKRKNIAQNKYKCTGLLFELLVRQITADTLAGHSDSAAMRIMQKRFNVNTELGKELQLYHAFFDNKPLTESRAMAFIELVCSRRKKLDNYKLAKEKYELIKEIKSVYPLKEFLSSRDPNYTINASIYKTFTSETDPSLNEAMLNVRDVANAKFTLVEHLSGKYRKKKVEAAASDALMEFKRQSEDLRLLSYQVLIEKFNNKYGALDVSQKKLLREYINNVTNIGTLREHVHNEIPRITESISQLMKSYPNKVTQIKLQEVVAQLNSISGTKHIQDSHMIALMLAYEIIKELSA